MLFILISEIYFIESLDNYIRLYSGGQKQ